MSDVAALAGVHKATASRALNPRASGLVNAATAERVRRAAEQLGFTPNTAARSLRTNRSFTAGVLLPDLTNPLFPPIARGIEEVLTARGYTALLANTDDDPVKERARFDALTGRQVDGFIVATAQRDHPLLERAHADDVPVVLINRTTDRPLFPLVTGDDDSGVQLAVRHLRDLGHRVVAHIAGPRTISTGHSRAQAFQRAAQQAGLDAPTVESAGYTAQAGAEATRALLEHRPDVTAILAGNDLIALGSLRVLRARGLRCPQDVSLVGFNDMAFADDFHPALTTVHVPHLELGAEAARLLLDRLDRPATADGAGAILPTTTVLLPLRLVVRASTAAPPAGA
jgi:LacI family transcriptional regulator